MQTRRMRRLTPHIVWGMAKYLTHVSPFWSGTTVTSTSKPGTTSGDEVGPPSIKRRHDVYTPEGELLERQSDKYAETEVENPLVATDSQENVYAFTSPWLFAEITKTTPSGDTQTIVSDSAFRKLVSFPVPSFPVLILGCASTALFKYLRKRRKAAKAARCDNE